MYYPQFMGSIIPYKWFFEKIKLQDLVKRIKIIKNEKTKFT